MIHEGALFYAAGLDADWRPFLSTWVARTLRAGNVHLVERIEGVTWVRPAFGTAWRWHPNIRAWHRRTYPAHLPAPEGLFPDKADALRAAIDQSLAALPPKSLEPVRAIAIDGVAELTAMLRAAEGS